MQLARILEPMPKTVPGKVKQILRALQLEAHYSEDEIPVSDINHVPMGA